MKMMKMMKYMGVRERKVESYLKQQCTLKLKGSMCEKWGINGNPDRIIIYKGNVYFIEVKTTDGKEQINQSRKLKNITENYCFSRTIYGKNDVDSLLSDIERQILQQNRKQEKNN